MLKNFADDLQYYRKKSGKELKEIAEETKIHSGILEKIEHADFTFQPQLYIRAFIKQYAKAIGLSPDKTLKNYDLAQAGKYSSDILPEKDLVSKPSEEIKHEINVDAIISQNKSEKINSGDGSEKENKKETESFQNTLDDNIELTDPKAEDAKKDFIEDNIEIKKEETQPEKPENVKKEQPLVTSQKKRTDEDIENKVINFKPSEKTMIASVKNDPKFATGEKYTPAIKSRSIDSSVFKNILRGIVVLLVAAGLIALFKVLFVDGGKDSPEIKRQNFDEVVKENEKKILGKRSDEEIRDSIAKADEDAKKLLVQNTAKYDSLTLDINAVSSGWLIVITDSINYKLPERIYFKKGDQETFKAKNFFHLSTPNSDAVDVKLNGKKLTFENKDFRYLKLTPNGIAGK